MSVEKNKGKRLEDQGAVKDKLGMTKRGKSHYRHVDGKRLIEVQVNSAQQLFDARDPAPFRERDLDDDFTEYLVASGEEFNDRESLKIKIIIKGPPAAELDREAILKAMHSYFAYQIDLKRIQLGKVFRNARLFCLIGSIILILCLTLSRFAVHVITNESLQAIVKEGLIIFGWVSMWRPLEVLLFDWYPHFDTIRLYRKLADSEMDVEFNSPSPR